MITSYFTRYSLLLVTEDSKTGPNVSIPRCCKYGRASQLTKHTQADKVSHPLVHVLATKFHFTHIYIPFILNLFNYIENNNELWCFKMIWFTFLGTTNRNLFCGCYFNMKNLP